MVTDVRVKPMVIALLDPVLVGRCTGLAIVMCGSVGPSYNRVSLKTLPLVLGAIEASAAMTNACPECSCKYMGYITRTVFCHDIGHGNDNAREEGIGSLSESRDCLGAVLRVQIAHKYGVGARRRKSWPLSKIGILISQSKYSSSNFNGSHSTLC